MTKVHLLIDGYRLIACGDGNGVPSDEDDTTTISWRASTGASSCTRR
jgi:hypothetical protein